MRKPPVGEKKKALKSKLSVTQKKLEQVQSQLQAAKRSEEAIAADLVELETQLGATRAALEGVKVRLAQAQAEQARVRESLSQSEQEVKILQQHLAQRMAANYRQGPVRYVSVLLGSHTMGELVSRAQLVRSIVKYESTLIAKIRASREQVLKWQQWVDVKAAEVAQQRQELITQQEQMAQLVLRRRGVFAEAQAKRVEVETQYITLTSDSQEIAAKLRALERSLVVPTRFVGRFVLPVAGPIVSKFGPRFHPILHYTRLHAGLDFGAASGTPIVAAGSGTVAHSGTMRGYGNVVVVDHGGGLSTLYAHCSVLLVPEGVRVEQGQVIARVGATGLATGPHLHFEVRRNGTPVNPLDNGL